MIPDAAVVERVLDGDREAYAVLVERYQRSAHSVALSILGDFQGAEDATQETFINVYRAAHKFRGDSKIGTWINRIAVNVCLEILRKNKKHAQRTDGDVSEFSHLRDAKQGTPFDQYRRVEIEEKVWGALEGLGDKHRDVVRLHDLEGFTIKEIARRLEQHDQQVIASQQTVIRQRELPYVDGEHTVITAKFPIRDATGRVVRTGTVATDITAGSAAARALRSTSVSSESATVSG